MRANPNGIRISQVRGTYLLEIHKADRDRNLDQPRGAVSVSRGNTGMRVAENDGADHQPAMPHPGGGD